MPSVFRIEMLPALHGDALWIEYGEPDDLHRVLIDGGPVTTYKSLAERLARVPGNERFFELIVLTHVDGDHVEGLVRLFADKPLPFSVDKVIFNGWRQMERSHGLLGALQGEFLSALLVNRASSAWDPDAAPWVVLKAGALPSLELPGGMKLTLLSPDAPRLQAMAKAWKKAVDKAGLKPGDLEAAWTEAGPAQEVPAEKGPAGRIAGPRSPAAGPVQDRRREGERQQHCLPCRVRRQGGPPARRRVPGCRRCIHQAPAQGPRPEEAEGRRGQGGASWQQEQHQR